MIYSKCFSNRPRTLHKQFFYWQFWLCSSVRRVAQLTETFRCCLRGRVWMNKNKTINISLSTAFWKRERDKTCLENAFQKSGRIKITYRQSVSCETRRKKWAAESCWNDFYGRTIYESVNQCGERVPRAGPANVYIKLVKHVKHSTNKLRIVNVNRSKNGNKSNFWCRLSWAIFDFSFSFLKPDTPSWTSRSLRHFARALCTTAINNRLRCGEKCLDLNEFEVSPSPHILLFVFSIKVKMGIYAEDDDAIIKRENISSIIVCFLNKVQIFEKSNMPKHNLPSSARLQLQKINVLRKRTFWLIGLRSIVIHIKFEIFGCYFRALSRDDFEELD